MTSQRTAALVNCTLNTVQALGWSAYALGYRSFLGQDLAQRIHQLLILAPLVRIGLKAMHKKWQLPQLPVFTVERSY
jgi:hypothetical protein